MFRVLSKRRDLQRYEKLGEETSTGLLDTWASDLCLSTSPAGAVEAEEIVAQGNPLPAKSHPLFGLFNWRRKKKTTAKPELVRYLAYVKEGGLWDANSSHPVMYSR